MQKCIPCPGIEPGALRLIMVMKAEYVNPYTNKDTYYYGAKSYDMKHKI